MKGLLIPIFGLLLASTAFSVSALQCLKCDRVISPRHCRGKTTCGPHEQCSVEQFTGLDGEKLYNVGCKSTELCYEIGKSDQPPVKRTTTQGEVITCSNCCYGDLCNQAGCGEIGFPSTRGPICYNCPQSLHPEKCDQIAVCGQDDVCHIQANEEFGDHFYTTKCLPKEQCNPLGGAFGRRGASKRRITCSGCCIGNLCNNNCAHNIVTSQTQTYTHTTPTWGTRPWTHGSTTPPWYHSNTSPWTHGSTTPPWYHSETSPWYHSTQGSSTTGIPQVNANCDFERRDLCEWTNMKDDNFDWIITHGETASARTGPSYDHTYKTSTGTYIYIESSSPRRLGDKAKLTSPEINSSGSDVCLQFWYHMYGSDIGELNVYVLQNSVEALYWSLMGSQGNLWKLARLQVSKSPKIFNFVIEGVRGFGYRGDIAIDDISILPTTCTLEPSNADIFHNTSGGTAQVTTNHRGLEYAIMFLPNQSPIATNKQIQLLITSMYYRFTVHIRFLRTSLNFTSTNKVLRVSLPTTLEITPNSDLIYSTGVLISSDRPISVVGVSNYGCCSSEAFNAIPVRKFRTKYVVAAYPNGKRTYGMVSIQDNTLIRSIMRNGTIVKVKINPMETNIISTGNDVTGMYIESDKPMGVFSGNQETLIHNGTSSFQTEMMIPFDDFAYRFIVPKIAKVDKIILRVVPAGHGGSTVYITGKNGFYKTTYKTYVNELELPNDGYFINAQRPVMVTLYTTYESVSLNPFMTLLPAVKQFSNNYVITTPNITKFDNFATVILNSKDNEDGLRLNGGRLLFSAVDITPINMFNDIFKSISVQLNFNDTIYEFTHVDPDVKFGLLVYGFKNNSAYGYPGGFVF